MELQVEGTRVHAEHHAPKRRRARGAVLLLHGFNSCLHEFGPLPERLAQGGFHVLAFDQRGFGGSGGERGLASLERVLTETEVALEELRRRAGKAPVAMVGHSLGAAMALGVLSRRGGAEAVVLCHPVVSLWDEMRLWERAAYHVLGRWNRHRTARGHGAATVPYRVKMRHLFEDQAAKERAKAVPFLQPKVNLSNYGFASTMDARTWAAHVHVPALCVMSEHDQVVDPDHSRQVCEALGGPVERLAHTGGHSLFLDRDGPQVCDTVAAWLRGRLEEAR